MFCIRRCPYASLYYYCYHMRFFCYSVRVYHFQKLTSGYLGTCEKLRNAFRQWVVIPEIPMKTVKPNPRKTESDAWIMVHSVISSCYTKDLANGDKILNLIRRDDL